MSKKFLMSFAPLVAVVAFALAPAAAQAVPHWYVNGTRLPFTSAKTRIKTFGVLTLHNATLGEVKCFVDDHGKIWNVNLTTAGMDEVQVFENYECEAKPTACPGITVTAEKLPWLTELTEVAGVIRDKIKGIQVKVVCPGVVEATFTGELTPKIVNSATVSFAEFDTPGSGSLTSTLGPGNVTGKDFLIGIENAEIITAKNP